MNTQKADLMTSQAQEIADIIMEEILNSNEKLRNIMNTADEHIFSLMRDAIFAREELRSPAYQREAERRFVSALIGFFEERALDQAYEKLSKTIGITQWAS